MLMLSCRTNFIRSPDAAKLKDKMLYASSKDALRKQLTGVHFEIQATDTDDVEFDTSLYPPFYPVLRTTAF